MKKAAVFKLAKGYFGRNKNVWTIARQKVHKGLQYSYRDRKAKKRSMHELWVTQINAATRQHGMVYSQFISSLVKEDVALNRKMLAELAVTEPYSFYALVSHVKERHPWRNIDEKRVKGPIHLSTEMTEEEKTWRAREGMSLSGVLKYFEAPLKKAAAKDAEIEKQGLPEKRRQAAKSAAAKSDNKKSDNKKSDNKKGDSKKDDKKKK